METVTKLEKISWINITDCNNCWNELTHIWWKDYIDDIHERYSDNESFLTIIRNQVWEIYAENSQELGWAKFVIILSKKNNTKLLSKLPKNLYLM